MSFWGGVAKGFEAGEAKREKETLRDDRLASEAKAESRWKTQWENTLSNQQEARDAAEAARILEQKRFDIGQDRLLKLDKKEQSRFEEAQALERAKFIMDNIPPSMLSALGGGPQFKGKGTPLSVAEMTAGAAVFDKLYLELDEDTSKSPFFTALSTDPGNKTMISAFMEAQAAKGNPVQLEDMPKYFKFLGYTEGKSVEESKKFLSSALNGEGFEDTAALVNGLINFSTFSTAKPLFAQINAPTSNKPNDRVAQVAYLQKAIEFDAIAKLESLSPVDQDVANQALAMLEIPANRTKGLSTLARFGFGLDAAQEAGMMENPIVAALYGGTPPAAPSSLTDTPPATFTEEEMDSFTPEEIREIVEANKGKQIIVGGKPFIFKVKRPAEPVVEVLNDDKAAGVTGRLDSKGEGFVKPEAVSEIDGLFEGANIEEGFGFGGGIGTEEANFMSGVSSEEGPYTPKVLKTLVNPADEIIEKGSNNIQTLIDSLGETKYGRTPRDKAIKVREGVLSELKEMGIEMPTNPTELGYFKDDLTSLLEDYNVDLSGDLLYEIVDIAKESAKTGRVAVPPEVAEEGYTPPTMEATELNTPAVREALANVPTEVADAIIAIVANGTEEEIVRANEEAIKEFGAVAAGVLFDNAKAARGTGRSAVMDGLQTPYSVSADEEGYQPTSMGATELNTPAMREAIAKVPAEVREAFASILERGDQEAIDEANKELAKEFGKDVASVLFDDAKSGRGTGKSAMMDGLQTPKELNTAAIREVLDMVKSEISSKVFSVLSKGYLQTTMGSTEVNTPAIRKALSKVEKQLGPEVAAVLTRGYQPTTLGSTELNTPAMRKALSKVPGKVQDSVTEVLKKGTLSEIKEAKVEITKDFGSKVASILFDNLKSGRGTGKSAMMDGLQ